MFPGIGVFELAMLGVIAILLFGKRLPEVARNIGRGYGELRKGLTELQSSISSEIDAGSSMARPDYEPETDFEGSEEPTAPRLEPPSSLPSTGPTDSR